MAVKKKITARKKIPAGKKTEILVTPGSIVLPNNAANQRKIQKCLDKSGEISLTFRKVKKGKIPKLGVLSSNVVVD